VEELKFLVESNFLNFQCVFRPRSCNKAAHELAVMSRSCVKGEEHISCDVPLHVLVADDLSASMQWIDRDSKKNHIIAYIH
jgi:hypothetical protein